MTSRAGVILVVLGLVLGAAGGTAIRRVGPIAEPRSNATDYDVVGPRAPTYAPMPQEIRDLAQEYEDRFNAGEREELDELACPENLPRQHFGQFPSTPIRLPQQVPNTDERAVVQSIDLVVSKFQAGEDGAAWVDYFIDVEMAEPQDGRRAFTGGRLRLREVGERWLICDDEN